MDIESVYTQYFKDVFLYVRSLSADAGTAEEIAQETFMKALKSLDSFDGSRDIRAWLFTIAKNTYYTFCCREHIYADPELAEGYTESRLPESKSQRFAEARVIKKLKNKIFRKKVVISLVTAAAVLAAGTGVYALLVLPESVIPYEESGVSVSSVSLGDLGGKYLYCSIGTSEAAGSVCHDPVTVQTEEGEKTVVILYAYSTPWSKYVETNLENGREDSVILEPLGSADEIDEVYYGEFEPVSEFYEDPDSVLEKAELIWSAESR